MLGTHIFQTGCVFGCCLYIQVRDEDVFKGLDNMVKNFLVSMPLVADLRSPAMRPRHWQQLMDTTKVGQGFRFLTGWTLPPVSTNP